MLPIVQAHAVPSRRSLTEKSSLPGLNLCHTQKLKKFEEVPGGNHEAVATRHGRLP